MKEKQFKGVWLKFIAVLVAVAMVIPLAFSGWASTRAYADDAAIGNTGDDTSNDTATTDNTGAQVVPIKLGTEFESGLDLDNKINTSDFSAVGGATSLGLTSNIWVTGGGNDLSVDIKADGSYRGSGDYHTVSEFTSGRSVPQQIWDSAEKVGRKIEVAGIIIDGKNQADYVKAADDAAAKVVREYLNGSVNDDGTPATEG